MTGVLLGLGGLIVLAYLRRLYRRLVKWPHPNHWQHPAGRIRRRTL